MPDPASDPDEDEYRAQAEADGVERASGGRPGEAGGHEDAEAAERASGCARD